MNNPTLNGVRFAPSPTGTFHVGNFRTAWISRWWAQALKMPWLIRFEDIDRPRVVPGAETRQTDEMRLLGLEAARSYRQSARAERHRTLFEKARQTGRIYACVCSRRDLRDALDGAASAPHQTGPIYNGRCRNLEQTPETTLPTLAWRFKAHRNDGSQDFIIGRTAPDLSSFLPAYNWACAIDDFDGRYALLVRAWDLSAVAEQQRLIQKQIAEWQNEAYQPQAIFHCALVTSNDGHRLEKRTKGVTFSELLAAGQTPDSLRTLFEKSFHASALEYSPGKIFGEARPTLRLQELGL